MRIIRRHPWNLTPREAMALQTRLAAKAANCGEKARLSDVRIVLGVDVAYSRPTDRCYAAAVALAFPSMEVLEEQSAAAPSVFPYVPGLLSYREIPALVKALRKARSPVDAILCDGQGIAHPRRMGLATHLGYLYDLPSVGCAKTRLIGEHGEVGESRGEYMNLVDGGEKIGEVVRTRDGVKPLYVSPGYKMSFRTARQLTLRCGNGYRLPEPTRLAHQATERLMREME